MSALIQRAIAELYRADWGRIVAALIRTVRDFDIAEEATQQAFEAALEQWPVAGVPDHPRGWIIQTARHRALDRLRRARVLEKKLETLAAAEPVAHDQPDLDPNAIPDDRLRLLFTCCHPALALEAQVALTLRTLGGLETDEIARAFLVPPVTMAQRLVRAKKKIATANIPYVVPGREAMPERLEAVLTVVYLVFSEGYASTRGAELLRADLCAEAISIARWLRHLMAPAPPAEVSGLLALMLLHHARRKARTDDRGDVILLEHQNRALWNRAAIDEALPLVDEALAGDAGAYTHEAAIAAAHCRATTHEATDWPRILAHYDALERLKPSPVVALNRAVAVAMVHGPAAGLALVDALAASGALETYHLLHAARADLCRRLGDTEEATKSYERALTLVGNESERRFLERRLREVRGAPK